jgi:hypothetical protein
MKNLVYLVIVFLLGTSQSLAQSVTLHPVPEEFASDYYVVTVNGKPVPVFHAGLNVYFASFDFTGKADITVSPKVDSDKYAGQTSNKEAAKLDAKGYWRGEVSVRPLSRNVKPQLTGSTVKFSLAEAGQYSVERVGTGTATAAGFKDDALFLFANRPDTNLPNLTAKNGYSSPEY